MKVTRESPPFSPITVTLETEAEATWLWACLDIPHGMILGEHCARPTVGAVSITTSQGMWETLDKVYHVMDREEVRRKEGWRA